jgi:uncharacterized RDD family membrane protein YckC
MVAPYPSPSAPVPPAPAGDPTAVFGRRILAFLIDVLLLAIPVVVLSTSNLEYLEADQLDRSGEQFCEDYLDQQNGICLDLTDMDDRVYFADDLSSGTVGFWGAVLAGFLLHVLLQGVTGWTIGKLVTGIRTVQEDGSVVGIGRAFLRWLLLVVDGQPCGLPLVGLITAGTSTGHRRVGDMAAKTYVVRASAAGSPIVLPGSAPAPAGGWGAPAPWGQSPAPTGWGDPTPPAERTEGGWAAPEVSAPNHRPAPSAGTEPQWDAARNTYIQWDPAQSRWVQWDDAARTWTVIPGQ